MFFIIVISVIIIGVILYLRQSPDERRRSTTRPLTEEEWREWHERDHSPVYSDLPGNINYRP